MELLDACNVENAARQQIAHYDNAVLFDIALTTIFSLSTVRIPLPLDVFVNNLPAFGHCSKRKQETCTLQTMPDYGFEWPQAQNILLDLITHRLQHKVDHPSCNRHTGIQCLYIVRYFARVKVSLM